MLEIECAFYSFLDCLVGGILFFQGLTHPTFEITAVESWFLHQGEKRAIICNRRPGDLYQIVQNQII